MDVGGPSRGVPTAAVSVGTAGVTPATDGSTAAVVVAAVAAVAAAAVAIFSIIRVGAGGRMEMVTCCFITLPSKPSPAGDAVALMVSTCIPHGRAGRGSVQFTNCQHKEKKKKERYIYDEGKGCASIFTSLPPHLLIIMTFLPCAERLAVIQHRKCP